MSEAKLDFMKLAKDYIKKYPRTSIDNLSKIIGKDHKIMDGAGIMDKVRLLKKNE